MRDRNGTRFGGAGTGGPEAAPDGSWAAQSEEWTWMVDESPALYLEEAASPTEKGHVWGVVPLTEYPWRAGHTLRDRERGVDSG